MTITDDRNVLRQAGGMVVVPGARYTTQEFFDLEIERLWPRVWQVACREEEIPNCGDFLEYTIGDQSILVVRSDHEDIRAFFNACPHRGTRLASGVGSFATPQIRCPYHGWRWSFEGEIAEVVDRHEFPDTMTDDLVCLGEVQVGRWGGFVFVNMDQNCEPFDSFLGDIPESFRHLPLPQSTLSLLPDDRLRVQLEDRGRRLQRGLPPAGSAPPDALLVQRHPLHL